MNFKKILIFTTIILLIILFSIKLIHTNNKIDIKPIKSSVDFNGNGVDDYTDILNGAKIEAKNKPKYDGRAWSGGYPPDNIGVCTDLIWRAFKHAGYNIRDMVNKDIKENPKLYPNVQIPDKDIDFRRVKNLNIFFNHYATSLTVNPYEISEWQPGDIVIYETHIAIVSDVHNKKGIPYIIHNWGQQNFEEDALMNNKIVGHYRFDASIIDRNILIRWN